MMPGLIVLTRAPRFPHRTSSAITAANSPSWTAGTRAGGVLDLVGLQHRQGEQLIGRRRRESRVLVSGQGTQPVPGLGRDHYTGTALGDDFPELLEHDSGAVQIHRQEVAGDA